MIQYMGQGLSRDKCLGITGLTKNQFYYNHKGSKPGKGVESYTRCKRAKSGEEQLVSTQIVVDEIVRMKQDPDQPNYYKLLCCALCLKGYMINHKKVYRIMKEYDLLESARKRVGRNFVKYRRVCPGGPLEILEMDIKYIWVYEHRKYAFVLTVIDTFTRYVLHWDVGYQMRSEQIKQVWEYVVAHYLQRRRHETGKIDIEVRNDNGKQFSSQMIVDFFKDNELVQVFTHPYTPEENGHVESFHGILGKSLGQDRYASIHELEMRLERFYETYNNIRCHGSILGLPPAIFWAMIDQDQIEVQHLDKRRTKFAIKVLRQDISSLAGINKYKYRAKRA